MRLKQKEKQKLKSYQTQNSSHVEYHLDLALSGFSGLFELDYFKYHEINETQAP